MYGRLRHVLFVSAIVVFTLILAACGSEAEPTATPQPEPEPTAEPTTAPAENEAEQEPAN